MRCFQKSLERLEEKILDWTSRSDSQKKKKMEMTCWEATTSAPGRKVSNHRAMRDKPWESPVPSLHWPRHYKIRPLSVTTTAATLYLQMAAGHQRPHNHAHTQGTWLHLHLFLPRVTMGHLAGGTFSLPRIPCIKDVDDAISESPPLHFRKRHKEGHSDARYQLTISSPPCHESL